MSETLAVVKIVDGGRIPLTKPVLNILDLQKGDLVMLYRNNNGEIALAKPTPPGMEASA